MANDIPSTHTPEASQADSPSGHSVEAGTLTPTVVVAMSASVTPAFPAISGYEILGELGRGGMGVVYKAKQIGLNRLVAIKMILTKAHAGAELLTRFKSEAESVARLQHPNIVQIYEIGEHDGLPFFSMEYVEGGSLAHKLKGEPQQPRDAAKLVEILAIAIHAAHQKQIVHRDLKPLNVLISSDGTPKVTDFGLAKQLDADTGQTQSGAVFGTPSYMAPEQAEGRIRDIGPRTDVYALGAILYELLTGRPPFRAASALDTLEQVRTADPVPPRQLQPKTPRDLETICLKCLLKDSIKRFASAKSLAADLRRFLASEPIVARPVGPLERGWRWCWRNPAVATLVGVVGATLLGGVAVSTFFAYQADERALDATNKGILAKEHADRADREKVLAWHNLYASQMMSAGVALRDGEVAYARQLLEEQIPTQQKPLDFRGFEWHQLYRLCHDELRSNAIPGSLPPQLGQDTPNAVFSPNGELVVAPGPEMVSQG